MKLRDFGLAELKKIEPFITPMQLRMLRSMMGGDDAQGIIEQIQRLTRQLRKAPLTRGQEGTEDPIVHVHYFYAGCDWWITELDVGHPEDEPGDFQSQMFGFVCLGDPLCAELGYISLPELKSGGHPIEIDLHWEPTPLSVIRKRLDARSEPEPEPAPEPEPERSGRRFRIPANFF